MPSKLTTLFTSALALCSLQAFLSTSGPTALQVAFADSSVKYQPPNRVGPQRTEGSGTRGSDSVSCPGQSEKLFISVLSPTNHTGQTSLGRPTLYAYFTGTQTLEIRLSEVGKSGHVWTQNITPKQPGFQTIAYPTNQPELVKGKNYQWSASVLCNPQKFERINGISVGITRVDEPTNLQEALKAARTANDRAQVYSNDSLWYEALDTLVTANLSNPKDQTVQTALISLLDQVGLTKTAEKTRAAAPQEPPQAENLIRQSIEKLPLIHH